MANQTARTQMQDLAAGVRDALTERDQRRAEGLTADHFGCCSSECECRML